MTFTIETGVPVAPPIDGSDPYQYPPTIGSMGGAPWKLLAPGQSFLAQNISYYRVMMACQWQHRYRPGRLYIWRSVFEGIRVWHLVPSPKLAKIDFCLRFRSPCSLDMWDNYSQALEPTFYRKGLDVMMDADLNAHRKSIRLRTTKTIPEADAIVHQL